MAKQIEIPQDAFTVKNTCTTFEEAKQGEPAVTRYNKFLAMALDAGYEMHQAIKMAEADLQNYFKMYMEKYYPNKEITR